MCLAFLPDPAHPPMLLVCRKFLVVAYPGWCLMWLLEGNGLDFVELKVLLMRSVPEAIACSFGCLVVCGGGGGCRWVRAPGKGWSRWTWPVGPEEAGHGPFVSSCGRCACCVRGRLFPLPLVAWCPSGWSPVAPRFPSVLFRSFLLYPPLINSW